MQNPTYKNIPALPHKKAQYIYTITKITVQNLFNHQAIIKLAKNMLYSIKECDLFMHMYMHV